MLLTSLAIGFLWGTLISVVNYLYLQWVMKKNADKPPQKATLAVVNAHFLRYFLNIGALFVVYRHMWVLVGTAVGLTVMNAVSVVRYYREGRQQIEKSKRFKRTARGARSGYQRSGWGSDTRAETGSASPEANGHPPQEDRPGTDVPAMKDAAEDSLKPDLLPKVNPFGREDP